MILILKNIGQCESKRIMKISIKNNVFSLNLNDSDTEKYRSVWRQTHYDATKKKKKKITSTFKISIYIIRLAAKLAIMYILAFITAVILHKSVQSALPIAETRVSEKNTDLPVLFSL